MLLRSLAAAILAGSALGQVGGSRPKRPAGRVPTTWERWVGQPRNAVLFVLAAVLLGGGGRKLLQAWRARGAIGRLDDPAVTTEAVEAAADHGRAGLLELFRLLGSSESQAIRDAAGHALSVLWARDELIAEEEKALVRRGYQVRWTARRRYPRGLRSPIPIAVAYGVHFLREGGPGASPENLEWSHRVMGARRASLEVFSPWVAGPGRAGFELIPSDFETDGPHKLVLQARVRTLGLTEPWELEVPHVPFTFEFDPRLDVRALLALPDDARAAAFARAVRLGGRPPAPVGAEAEPSFLKLNEGLAVRDVPGLEVTPPLPCDLAHAIEVEFAGVPGRFAAGALTLSGQGEGRTDVASPALRFQVGPVAPVPAEAIERPGRRPIRARLVPDPDRGWADPDVRSIWPGTIETDWVEVEIVRI
jgi:hypothetical protein